MTREENPAKVYLRRYLGLSGKVDALSIAIDRARERASYIGCSLNDVKVKSSPIYDRMASNVCSAVDACGILTEYQTQAETALREIITAIESLDDEREKELLTRRYIAGQDFDKIIDSMHYEKSQTYAIHNRALAGINAWLQSAENHFM